MKRKLLLVCLSVLAYIPFHALITTWLISNFGHEAFFKAFKDIVVAIVGICSVTLAIRSKLKLSSIERTLLICLGAFVGLHLVWLPFASSTTVALAGLIVNLRYFVLFGSLYFLSRELKINVTKIAFRIVVAAAIAVMAFGFLQSTVLPRDFLRHFGYGADIPPYQLVDKSETTVRIISTLRGPNSLGAYLVIAIALFVFVAFQKQKKWQVLLLSGLASTLVLYRTYSRAAWIAVPLSSFLFLVLYFKSARKRILIVSSVLFIALVSTIIIFRNSSLVQKTVFHINPSEASQVNSDDMRLESLQIAVSDITNKPLGHGVGSSGIASFRGDKPYITENYILEVTYQLGILGGLLLITIYILVGKMLIKNLADPLVLVLFCSFIGIMIISLSWPVWSDETVAYTWWGLAGATLGRLGKPGNRGK